MVQHGLGLIVGAVPGGDPACAIFSGDTGQPLIAHLPGGLFKIVAGLFMEASHIDSLRPHGKPQNIPRSWQICNKCLVSITIWSTKLMIEMSNNKSVQV